jgi:predicted pyridoxine 5'-phosphate oxidase superfamily flavin-nucleotide-binding protein
MSDVQKSESPWHAGELALQKSVGVAERMEVIGRRVLRDHLIDQHRTFYRLLPFVVVGAVDPDGDVWATVRAAPPGFLQSPDPCTLHVDLAREAADPADRGLEDGDAVALLGIELKTRRRNRLNGTIRRDGTRGFDVIVGHSFGNCPQYIQLRDARFVRDPAIEASEPAHRLERLNARARELIANADTFFVSSYVDRERAERQVDVSHRGGKPGFVRIGDDGVLTVPDFAGNLFFNTLGNFMVNSRAGLVFVDFERGDLLQLTGDAEVLLDDAEVAAFQGAERLWRFRPRQFVHRPGALALRWQMRDGGWSPNSLLTGSWQDAAARKEAAQLAKHSGPSA